MIVIAVLAIPFVFYFNKTDFGAARSGVVARLYGRNVYNVEVERNVRLFDLARDLGMINFLQDLVTGAQNERQAKEQFSLNLLILRHEAETLGVRSTPAETADALKRLPAFLGKDGFDLQKYNDAVQNYLGPRGFTEAQLEELVADQVCLDRIKQLLGTGVTISETENQKNFDQLYSKLEAAVVRLKAGDFAGEVKISDDDIKKYYEANKDQLKSDEKRKVQFVAITLPEPEKKLTGKERVTALQKLSDKANDVVQALGEKGADFAAVAVKSQLPIYNTTDFTQEAPDPQLKQDPQLAQAAFQLSEADPTGEPVEVADGFYILHLAGITPAKPLALEEAKPKIAEALRARQERELVSTRGTKLVHDLREALKSGDAVAAAAQKLGLKLEKVPPFVIADELDEKASPPPENTPDLPAIKQAVADLKSSEVADPIPTKDGALIAVLEKRDPPDSAQAGSNRAALADRLLRGKRNLIFYEWLRERRRVAGVQVATAS